VSAVSAAIILSGANDLSRNATIDGSTWADIAWAEGTNEVVFTKFGSSLWTVGSLSGAPLGSGDFRANGSVPMTGNIDMGGNSITNVAWDSWFESTALTPASTVTVIRTDGPYLSLELTNNTELAFDVSSFPTNGSATVSIGMYIGAHDLTRGAGIESNSWEALSISTNGWTDVIFRKGHGQTEFIAR
jgi:hypothetical protein